MTETNKAKSRPDASAYVVREFTSDNKEKSDWIKVGVVWKHSDEEGFNVDLAPGIAVTGKLVIRTNKVKDK
jgi:hypothetical protein